MKARDQLVLIISLIFWQFGYNPLLYSQENYDFISIKSVESDFHQELRSVKSPSDTIEVYVNYIKRLIKRGNYQKADTILQDTMDDFRATNDTLVLIDLYTNRAFGYKVQGMYTKALSDYLWLKEYYEAKKDPNGMVEIYTQMAEYYRASREFQLMDKHLEMAFDIIEKQDIDKKNIAYWYSRKAAWETEYGGNNDSIEIFAQEGYRLGLEAKDKYTQALTLNELGYLYQHQDKPMEVFLSYYERSRKLFFDQERYNDYVNVTINYIRQISGADDEKTYEIIEQILPMQRENQWFSLIPTLGIAINQYSKRGQTEKIYRAKIEAYEARHRENYVFMEIALSEMALNYENELTKKELEVQEQQTQFAKAEAQNNKLAFIYTAVIAVILLIVTFAVIKINRDFKKKNLQLAQGKIDLEASNSKLTDSLNHQKSLYQELNHRVKNNLTILSGLIYLQELNEEDQSSQAAFETLRNRINSMALIHETLYNSKNTAKIDFQLYLNQLIQELKQSFTNSGTIDTEIKSEGYEIEMIQAVPLAMLLNEFFTNSIKHAFKDTVQPIISVETIQGKKETIIEYRDNGCGYTPNKNSYNTLGLRLTTLLTKQLNGSFDDLTSPKGVFYRLAVPHI
jgi:two-component sensor histidine kinase